MGIIESHRPAVRAAAGEERSRMGTEQMTDGRADDARWRTRFGAAALGILACASVVALALSATPGRGRGMLQRTAAQ